MYDRQTIDRVRDMAGLKPLTSAAHHQAELADIDKQIDAHERKERRAQQRVAAVCSRLNIPNPLVFAQSAVSPDPTDEKVRATIAQTAATSQTPMSEALATVAAKKDPQTQGLWKRARDYLILAGRNVVADNPKVTRETLIRSYRVEVEKIIRALDLQGVDIDAECQEMADLALAIAPAAGKRPDPPTAPDGMAMSRSRGGSTGDPLKITRNGKPISLATGVYMTHHSMPSGG